MDERQLRQLVEAILRQILAAQGQDTVQKPKVLLLLTGAEGSLDRELEFVRVIRSDYQLKAHAAACYTDRYPIDPFVEALGGKDLVVTAANAPARDRLVDEAQAAVLLMPLRTTVAKAARGFSDSPPGPMILRALMQGKPVFSAAGELDTARWPDTMPGPMRHGQGSLAEWVEQDLKTLESWGFLYRRDPLELVAPLRAALLGEARSAARPAAPTSLPPAVPATKPARGFLTAEDVRRQHAEGQRLIQLTPGTIVTDEARDVARALLVDLAE
jgi:hypothetical protein